MSSVCILQSERIAPAIHTLTDTLFNLGKAEGSIDAGQMIKPALARGLQLVGATTRKPSFPPLDSPQLPYFYAELENALTMEQRATRSKTGAQSNVAGKVSLPKGAPKTATKAVKAKSKKADLAKVQKAEGVSLNASH